MEQETQEHLTIENIIFTLQHFSRQNEYLLPLLELISTCLLYRDLGAKFSNFSIECEDFRSYIVKSCQSFGILLKSIHQSVSGEDIISRVKKLFENIMKQGYKLEDKCLRNDILILLELKIFVDKPQAHSIQSQTNFLEVLLFYATIDGVTFYNEPITTNYLKAFFGTDKIQ